MRTALLALAIVLAAQDLSCAYRCSVLPKHPCAVVKVDDRGAVHRACTCHCTVPPRRKRARDKE